VSSAPRAHHQARRTSSMATPTTPQLPPRPRRLLVTDQLCLRAPQPLPKRQRPAGPCPHTPHNPIGGTESNHGPACGPTFHHRQLSRLVRFTGPWPVPTVRCQRAVQLRNTATPPTNTGLQRPPLASDLRAITIIDRSARSSGRRP